VFPVNVLPRIVMSPPKFSMAPPCPAEFPMNVLSRIERSPPFQ